MDSFHCRNYQEFLVKGSHALLNLGKEAHPRGKKTFELENVGIELSHPRERHTFLEGRLDNPIAAIFETMWILAGRNDVDFLVPYIHRAPLYSDDGKTWRAGYGPRLINDKFDQIDFVLETLKNDPDSRRAAIAIWFPGEECKAENAGSKDFPCNNMLYFLIRDGKLNMKAISRSMDLLFGSYINFFEWSVLQEFIATCLGLEVGTYFHYISSLHVYDCPEVYSASRFDGLVDKSEEDRAYRGKPKDWFYGLPEPSNAFDRYHIYGKEIRDLIDPSFKGDFYGSAFDFFREIDLIYRQVKESTTKEELQVSIGAVMKLISQNLEWDCANACTRYLAKMISSKEKKLNEPAATN